MTSTSVDTDQGVGSSEAKRDTLAIIALAVIAAGLRAPGLAPSSLWMDDAWVAFVHRLDAPFDIFMAGVTAPGFAFLLKGVFSTVGFSEIAAQSLPFAAGIIGPPATYLLARALGINGPLAMVAGGLIAVSSVHIEYSVAVKQFTLDLVLVIAMMWLAVRVLSRPTHLRWLALTSVSILATVTSASVVPAVVAAFAAVGLARRQSDDRREGVWVLGYAVFLVAWTWIILNNVQASLTSYWSDEIASGPVEMLAGMARTGGLFLGTDHLLLGAMLLVGLALGAWKAPSELRILVWGPVLLAGAASLLGVPLGTGRTDLYLYAPLAIACAWTLQELLRPSIGLLTGLALILVSAIPLEPAAYQVEDTRPLIQDVDTLMTSDSTLIAIGAEYALMTYAEWPVSMEVRRVPTAIRSWIPAHHDVDVRTGLSWWETRDQFAEAFPSDLSDRVLVLHTHVPRERLRWANDELERRGFEHERTYTRPGASLTVYERHQD